MKIDLTQKILNQHGDEITAKLQVAVPKTDDKGEVYEELEEKLSILTLGKLLQDSLLRSLMKTDIEETLFRYNLYLKIKDKDEIELSEEEINKFKEYINHRYEVLLAGQAIEMLSK